MADCSPATLAANAGCFTCQSEKKLLGMEVYLLAQVLLSNNPMADVSPQFLVSASACYTACLSGKELLGAAVYLLCQMSGGSEGGGGIGCGNTFIIRDAPTNPEPPPPNINCVYWLDFRNRAPTLKWDNVGHFWF